MHILRLSPGKYIQMPFALSIFLMLGSPNELILTTENDAVEACQY